MSVFEPLTLPAELKLEIRQLAEELELKVAADPGQEAPDLGSSEPLRLAPQASERLGAPGSRGRGRDVHVVCTQPRRLAAVSLASRVSWERGERSDGHGSTGHEVAAGVWSDVDCNRGFLDPEGRYSQATLLALRSIPESLVPFQLISAATCMSRMQRDPALRGYEFVPLHSSVPPNEQYKAFHPASSGRKAILSTDIAETSITIPDIICVVDTGLARVKKHTNLEVVWASQANLLQRCGRAGRVQHGSCVHLFTRSRFGLLDPEPTPEMRRVPLDEAMLSVCDLGLDFCKAEDVSPQELEETGPCAYVMSFLKQAPDPPEPKDVRSAFRELQHVGALDRAGFLTHLGALLVRLPMSPGLGCAFYLASLLGFPEAASQVCAALDGREPFGRRPNEERKESGARRFAAGSDGEKRWSDVFAMAKALGDRQRSAKRGGSVGR
eukprot:g17323.t1